jgi:DNA mismatch repair protein MSH3
MPATPSKQLPGQTQLSHFFSPNAQDSYAHTPAKKRARSPIEIDDDDDDDDDEGGETASPHFPRKVAKKPGASSVKSPPAAGLAGWSFDPSSPIKEPERPRESTDAIKKRREEFRKRLLQEAGPPRSRSSVGPPPVAAATGSKNSPVELDSDSDSWFKQLTATFARKSVSSQAKGKAAVKPKPVLKKAQEIGPSGEPYTPLEKQVLQLKADNPGTLLMIEVGYKYKFFGEDAKARRIVFGTLSQLMAYQVAARELGMVAFQDRNFIVAGIPLLRKEIHLKK